MICDGLDVESITQTICTTVVHNQDRETGPLVCMVARNWNIGIGEQSQGENWC